VRVTRTLNRLKSSEHAHKIVDVSETSESPASIGTIEIERDLEKGLRKIGIVNLYSHQVDAISAIRRGENVLISTPTASGKSLIYHIPTIETIMQAPGSTALYIFPTKALTSNQQLELATLIDEVGGDRKLLPLIYHGDTDPRKRTEIRRELKPNILLTNPDMVHCSFLQHHHLWGYLFRNLRYVVLDEVHVYRGVFGSHVGNVIRRLNRICDHYGSKPIFICSTATIANPEEFITKLTGKKQFTIIKRSGAPTSKKHFVFWNPYHDVDAETNESRKANIKSSSGTRMKDSRDILIRSVLEGLQTICFMNSRTDVELLGSWCRDTMETDPALVELIPKIVSYRSGYLQERRKEIEERLVKRELEGVITTNALELGINIGNLDACILSGYPGTICSTWQRAGRVGRRGKEALIFFIAGKDTLNQYIVNHPEVFNIDNPTKNIESAIIDPYNSRILKQHILCAGSEIPLGGDYMNHFGIESVPVVDALLKDGLLRKGPDGMSAARRFHQKVRIRSIGPTYSIYHLNDPVGDISSPNVFRECYPRGIYLHDGTEYFVEELDTDKEIVRVSEFKVEGFKGRYFTRPIIDKSFEIVETGDRREIGGFTLNFGTLEVTEEVMGFTKYHRFYTDRKIGEVTYPTPIPSPPLTLRTKGLWIEIDADRFDMDTEKVVAGGHGIEHNMISLLPLLVMCDPNDVGGVTTGIGRTVIIALYDGYDGGIGYARKAFDKFRQLAELSLSSISRCKCYNGCPNCIMSSSCGNSNEELNKYLSIRILETMLGKKKAGRSVPPVVASPFKHSLTEEDMISDLRQVIRTRIDRDQMPFRSMASGMVFHLVEETRDKVYIRGGNGKKQNLKYSVFWTIITDLIENGTAYRKDYSKGAYYLSLLALLPYIEPVKGAGISLSGTINDVVFE